MSGSHSTVHRSRFPSGVPAALPCTPSSQVVPDGSACWLSRLVTKSFAQAHRFVPFLSDRAGDVR
eukprot:scaffold1717_cov377-Prasinococcus_capsulatus_cf.AAC.12